VGIAESLVFLRGVPDGELRRTVFEVDRRVVQTSLARRIISAKDGVVISAQHHQDDRALRAPQPRRARGCRAACWTVVCRRLASIQRPWAGALLVNSLNYSGNRVEAPGIEL